MVQGTSLTGVGSIKATSDSIWVSYQTWWMLTFPPITLPLPSRIGVTCWTFSGPLKCNRGSPLYKRSLIGFPSRISMPRWKFLEMVLGSSLLNRHDFILQSTWSKISTRSSDGDFGEYFKFGAIS